MSLNHRIQAARGARPVDLLLTNARIIDVFGGDIIAGQIAICDGHIVGFGDYAARARIDLKGRYVAPGFIDAHVHLESAMVGVNEFVRAVLPSGTTTVVADPHEIANVMGVDGIAYMLDSAQSQPLNIFFAIPSCVPSTEMESAGARLWADDLTPWMAHEQVVALAEMMNYPGVISEDPDVLAKIAAAKTIGKPVDGHAPGLSGRQLYAYLTAGIASDHECVTRFEATEKLRAGVHIMVREGTCARNLDALFPLINARTARRMMWCTDDRHPKDLLDQGHIDAIVRAAIAKGLDPILAIQMATLNPAEYFHLDHIGAIAPGRQADLVVFSDLYQPVIESVFHSGRRVASKGRIMSDVQTPVPRPYPPSMKVAWEGLDFKLKVAGTRVRVIQVLPEQVVTEQILLAPTIVGDEAVADPKRDLLKLAVIERHRASGAMGMGFVRGFGLHKGALASTVAHDSHNLIVVGVTDKDMSLAARTAWEMGGGLAVVADETVLATVPLPIAGLMSEKRLPVVRQQMDDLLNAAETIGAKLQDPFMALGFLALPVVPELKLTDQGLVDVNRFEIVPLFIP